MLKDQIQRMDEIKLGTPCSASVTFGGKPVASIDNGIFFQRAIKDKGAAWEVTCSRDSGTSVMIYENSMVQIMNLRRNGIDGEKKGFHFRIDL